MVGRDVPRVTGHLLPPDIRLPGHLRLPGNHRRGHLPPRQGYGFELKGFCSGL